MEYTFELLQAKLDKLEQSQIQLDKDTDKLLATINTILEDREKLVPKPTSR